METATNKPKCEVHCLCILIILVSFFGCTSPKTICKSKKIYKKDRIYYDFSKKELFKNAEHNDTLRRPIIMKETKEIQVEITKFNPLRYDIIVEDTAYDRFNPNLEEFSKFIILPETLKIESINKGVSADNSEKAIRKPDECDTIISLVNEFAKYSQDLKIKIGAYKTYLTYIENANNYYQYLKSMEVITRAEVDSGIVLNIIDPVNKYLPENKKLTRSSSMVFKSDFINREVDFYEQVKSLKPTIKSVKDRVDKLEKKKCKDFDAKKTEFNKAYQASMDALEEFETTRTNKVLPDFTKVMLVYEKLQSLAKNEPFYVTKSYPVSKDIQTISIFKYDMNSKTRQLHDAISIQLTRGFRIDVSGGVFVSGLYDEKYSLFSKDSIFTSKYIHAGTMRDTLIKDKFTAIYSNRNTNISFGGMIFLQAHSQNAYWFNYGGYLGLGALFNDQTRWTGSCGISFIFGRNHRCFINIGPAISQVDRLSEPYKSEIFYQKSIDNIPISKEWMYSWMLGFSWKIGK